MTTNPHYLSKSCRGSVYEECVRACLVIVAFTLLSIATIIYGWVYQFQWRVCQWSQPMCITILKACRGSRYEKCVRTFLVVVAFTVLSIATVIYGLNTCRAVLPCLHAVWIPLNHHFVWLWDFDLDFDLWLWTLTLTLTHQQLHMATLPGGHFSILTQTSPVSATWYVPAWGQ